VLGSIMLLPVSIVIPGRITLAWADGLRQTPVRAMVKGGQRAFMVGSLVMLFFWAATGGKLPLPQPPSPQMGSNSEYPVYAEQYASPSPADAGAMQLVPLPLNWALFIAIITGLQWAALGVAAGYALEKRLGKRRVMGVLGALVGAASVVGILVTSLPNVPAEVFFSLLAQAAGWGVGLVLYHPAEAVLRLPDPAPAPGSPGPDPPALSEGGANPQ
jgi:hypothetical protein